MRPQGAGNLEIENYHGSKSLTLSRVRVSHSSFSLKIYFKKTPCVCLSVHLCLAALGGSAEQAVLKTDQGTGRCWELGLNPGGDGSGEGGPRDSVLAVGPLGVTLALGGLFPASGQP